MRVGIVKGKSINFVLNVPYKVNGMLAAGEQVAEYGDGGIFWNGGVYEALVFEPIEEKASFSLKDVIIGINFHWERAETQTFLGTLRLITEGESVCAVNELPVEKYLESVISSEMKATSGIELLKAHAVISRSWLLAQMQNRQQAAGKSGCQCGVEAVAGEGELIRWYDRQDHTLFDVCADDHCQRYQGITKETSDNVAKAVGATRGEVLLWGNELCDARFSKSCGGVSEEFQYCWEDTEKPYLKAIRDKKNAGMPDLTIEENAEKWIRSNPEAFCNTTDKGILLQVLNDYDMETPDFYRWHVTYTQAELSALIRKKLGIDFGQIMALTPIERGKSGRLVRLKIVGTLKTLIIGKELEIRKALSESHLYSSAFVTDAADVEDGVPQHFDIYGAGWGHGVGLCQIGAAVMGEQGYSYQEILHHYYLGADIKKIYA